MKKLWSQVLFWYNIPRIMANFLWYYICFPFSLSWSSIFLCNIPQPGVRCPMRLVSVRYYLLVLNIKFFIFYSIFLNIKYSSYIPQHSYIFVYSSHFRCLKQAVSVTYYLIVFDIVFNTQFSIFNILFSNILHTFSNVSEPDWVCQIFWLMLTAGAIWFAFKVEHCFFLFQRFS